MAFSEDLGECSCLFYLGNLLRWA